MNALKIEIDDLSNPEVINFLNEHLQHMIQVTPPGYVHALDIEALRNPEITFWTVWEAELLLCCGALKKLNPEHAELKSMRTTPTHLGKGIASFLLDHILSKAKELNYQKIYLETGSYEVFQPARKLYEKFGFTYCEPFADYKESVNSVYMSVDL